MAKLLKLRRGTTAQHGSFTGAEGEVTIDTTKDTAVVHDGAQAGGRPLAREDMSNVSSANILGRISNGDIVGTKLENSGVTAGSYGGSTAIPIVTVDAQGLVTAASTTAIDSTTIANGSASVAVASNGPITSNANHDFSAGIDVTGIITSTGNVNTSGNINITNETPKISFIDSGNNPDFSIQNNNGQLRFLDTTNNVGRIVIQSDGTVDVAGNLDANGGLDVTGNITVSGTVDGVDVAALNTTVGNLGISGGAIASATTATTQSQGDNSTKVATTAYTDTAVSNLVDSSPGALNTLNELAAAINDDASFSTTVNNNIATKMPLAGGEFTGNVTCENITPDADSSRNLGTNSVRFANVYADNFVGAGSNLTGIESFVSGMILLWSGAENAIPSGFVLCNGSNSTPDLRDRFVVGAGNTYSVGATGGSNTGTDTVNISGSDTVSITVSGNATANVSSALSTYSTHYANYWRILSGNVANYSNGTITLPFSGSGTDTVNISGSDTVSIDNRPPYYALCYIMKT
jgi:hypothetical protein